MRNIKELCFESAGLLFNEFSYVFTDIFLKREPIYKNIILVLADGKYELEDIRKSLGLQKGGKLSEYLDELVVSGFVRRDYAWHIKTGKISKLSQYRISDNYLRFYLNYIAPNKERIEHERFSDGSLMLLPGWEGAMDLQFENLVLNNRQKLLELLGIIPSDIIYDNPFFQHATSRQAGCQIDYLIQTRFSTLYVYEIKFSKHPVTAQIIQEMQDKIQKIKAPRHVSFRPVLIHVNGVTDEVVDSQYFSDIIDFEQLLGE